MVRASKKSTLVTLFYYLLFNRRVEMNIRSVSRKQFLLVTAPLPLKGNSGSNRKVKSPCDDVSLFVTGITLCCLMYSIITNSFVCVFIWSILAKCEGAA